MCISSFQTHMICDNLVCRKSDDNSVLVTPNEGEVNVYPDSDRPMATRGNFNPADLFQFDSQAEMYSRPPSAASMRQLPSTNDFTTIYDKNHLDKLFGVNGHWQLMRIYTIFLILWKQSEIDQTFCLFEVTDRFEIYYANYCNTICLFINKNIVKLGLLI